MNPLTEQLAKLLENAPEEFRKNSRTFASTVLSQLNVVSREEFDAHCELLSRATSRLQELEKIVAQLEDKKKTQKKTTDSDSVTQSAKSPTRRPAKARKPATK